MAVHFNSDNHRHRRHVVNSAESDEEFTVDDEAVLGVVYQRC